MASSSKYRTLRNGTRVEIISAFSGGPRTGRFGVVNRCLGQPRLPRGTVPIYFDTVGQTVYFDRSEVRPV
jgi:hypothetical protein